MAVLAQGGRGVLVAKALLGLEKVPVGDQDGRDGVAQPVERDVAVVVPTDEGRNSSASTVQGIRVVWSGRRENSHSPNVLLSAPPRLVHAATLSCQSWAVAAPTVTVRARPVLVVVTT